MTEVVRIIEGDTIVVRVIEAGPQGPAVAGISSVPGLQDEIDALDEHLANLGNPHEVTAAQLGLGNVSNTSDATKNAAAVTLTNKTISADDNTVTDLETDNFKTGVVSTAADGAGATNSKLWAMAALKSYIDSLVAAGLQAKTEVRLLVTTNVDLSNELEDGDTLDGETLATGDRVALAGQSSAAQNGIYVVPASGAASRATDFDDDSEVPGALFSVREGTHAGELWICSDGSVTVDTDPITLILFSSEPTIQAGEGLSKTGNTLAIVGADNDELEAGSAADTDPLIVGNLGQFGGPAGPLSADGGIPSAQLLYAPRIRVSSPAIVKSIQTLLQEGISASAFESDVRPLDPDGVLDSYDCIQALLTEAIGLSSDGVGTFFAKMPPGRYSTSFPLLGLLKNGSEYDNVSFKFGGDAVGYVGGKKTVIVPQYLDKPAMIVQKARGVWIENISFESTEVVAPTLEHLLRGTSATPGNPWWNKSGNKRDNKYSPFAGVIFDPFKSATSSGDRYPDLDSYYSNASAGGGSYSGLYRVECQGFIVGHGYSLANGIQVGDSHSVEECNLSYNKVGYVPGQSQCRGHVLKNNRALYVETFVDGRNYGVGNAAVPTMYGNTLTYVRNFFNLTGAIQSGYISGGYAESLWRLGTWDGAGHALTIEGLHCKLVDAVAEGGGALPAADNHLAARGPVQFIGGYVGFNTNEYRRLNILHSAVVSFKGTVTDGVPCPQINIERQIQIEDMPIRFGAGQGTSYGARRFYNAADLPTLGASNIDARAVPGGEIIGGNESTFRRWRNRSSWNVPSIQSSVAVTVDGLGGATFTTTNPTILVVGDYVHTLTTWTSDDGTGTAASIASKGCIGRVASVDYGTGAVVLDKVPVNFPTGTYSLFLVDLPMIRARAVATTVSGSADITVVSNGGSVSVYGAGEFMKADSGIPTGARVLSRSGSVLTLTKPSTATGATAIYDALYELADATATSIPTTGVWRVGDFVKNRTPTVDGNNMVLEGWLCTVSGAFGTSSLPTFVPIYKSTVSPAT